LKTNKKFTIFIKFHDKNTTDVFHCDFYEIEPSIGKITIPDEYNIDKCTSFYIYPGICYLEKIVQHFGYKAEYEELQKKRQHAAAIKNNITKQINNYDEMLEQDKENAKVVEDDGRLYG